MEVYATGFNGHHQIHPDLKAKVGALRSFTRVRVVKRWEREPPIKIWAAFWSATVIEFNGSINHWGQSGELRDARPSAIYAGDDDIDSDDAVQFFGDTSGVLGALRKDGVCFGLKSQVEEDGALVRMFDGGWREIEGEVRDYQHIAIADNDEMCICTRSRVNMEIVLYLFSSAQLFFRGTEQVEPFSSHPLPCELLGLQASATSFVALLADHRRVWTFGSALHTSMLARVPTAETPADLPSDVAALGGIRIRKIVTCGWLCAALSEDRDLYVWGGRAGDSERVAALPDSEEEVKLVEVRGGVDIIDVAVGMSHMIVLTAQGEVWGCGDNEHGQLGPGKSGRAFVRDWVKVNSDFEDEGTVVSIQAGGWGSWIILDSRDSRRQQTARLRGEE